MRRRILLVSCLVVALLLGSSGLWAWRKGVASPDAWILRALLAIADAWLVPELDADRFSMADPTTVSLEGVRLHAGPHEVLSCGRITVSLGALPVRGEPLSIARIEIDSPTLTFRRDPTAATWRPIGFDPLLEQDAVADPEALDRSLQLSEVLDLRLVRIRNGVLIFDDAIHEPVRLDGIDLDLESAPETGEGDRAGHRARLVLGQPPGFELSAAGWIDLDDRRVLLDEGRVLLDLSDPAALARLTPQVRATLEEHAVRGRLELAVEGDLDLDEPLKSTVSLEGRVDDLHVVAEGVRLPVEEARLRASLSESLARIDEAVVRLPGGEARLTQGDLAVVEREVALAADWTLDGLPLHELLADGAASPSVAHGGGRVFVTSDPLSLGLTLQELSIGAPDQAPALRLGRGAVRGARLRLDVDPLVSIEAIELDGLSVDLRRRQGAWSGLPLPAAGAVASTSAPAAPPDAPDQRPRWAQLVHLDRLELTGGRVRIQEGNEPPWGIGGIGATLTAVGAEVAPPVAIRVQPGDGVEASASGRLAVGEGALTMERLSVQGPLDRAALQALLPPDARETVTGLFPAGDLTVRGDARVPLGAGAGPARVHLDATLSRGRLALGGVVLPVDEGAAAVSIDGGDLRIRGLSLQGAGGRVDVPALELVGDTLSGSWSVGGLDLRRVSTSTGDRLGTGRLTSTGALHGTVSSGALRGLSVVDADLSVDAGPAGRMRWPSINLHLDSAGGARGLRGRVVGAGGAQLDLAGSWPFDAGALSLESLTAEVDLSGEGRAALPPALQGGLEDVAAGRLRVRVSGAIDLDDPTGASTLQGVAELTGGVFGGGSWRIPAVAATLPLRLEGGVLQTSDARVDLLGGVLEVESGRWALGPETGRATWSARGLDLRALQPAGPGAEPIEGALNGEGRVELERTEDGLAFTGGRGEVSVRGGRLLPLPVFTALARADDGSQPGDDALEARFRLTERALELTDLQLDLGPVRYEGRGAMRWTGGVDLAMRARRDRRGLADLTARLVEWRITGTTDAPQVQALPLGVDTRTFAQQKDDPVDIGLEDADLDALETPGERAARPSSRAADEVEFNLDDFEGFE